MIARRFFSAHLCGHFKTWMKTMAMEAARSNENHNKKLNDEEKKAITYESPPLLTLEEERVFRISLQVLNTTGIKYAVGAAFARYVYTGIWRSTKDLDVFLRPEDLKTAMDALQDAGFETKIDTPHWLAKAWKDGYLIDLIFGTGHGLLPVTDSSFENSQVAEILGVTTRLFPIEEMIASAAFIAVRGRFDGAEVLHLIQGAKGKLDWQRILRRLGNNRQLLLWHLILFDFVYPGHSDYLPKDLMVELFEEMRQSWGKRDINPRAFRGMVVDPFSFRVDIDDWGYEDQRNMEPLVNEKGEVL
jgi:hypothetical protein